jgi:hypothetical protein
MIDPNSKITKKDRSINYWNIKRTKLHLKAAKILAMKRYNTADLTSLTETQLKNITKLATTKPNLVVKGKVK